MKELSVITIHKTIHMVQLWKMVQQSDESIRAFAARISGKADLCDLHVTCTKVGCATKVPYRDEVILQVLLQGMNDQNIRARTLTQTAATKLKKLSEVIEYVAAEETGILQSKDICHEGADVSGVRKSSYKNKKARNLLKLVATVVELPMARTQLRKGSSPVKLGIKTVLTAKSCIISNLYAGQRRQSQILLLRNQHQLSHPPSLAT